MSSEFSDSRGIKLGQHDKDFDDLLFNFLQKHAVDPSDAVFHFASLARRQWLKRFLSHTEIFKMTVDIPGDILEIGVYRGLSLLTWANLLEIFCIGDRTKRVFGVDNWGGFSSLAPEDGALEPGVGKEVGGFSPATFRDQVVDLISLFDADRFVPWKSRIELVDGDAGESVNTLLRERPGLRFSLVHFDVDLYRPTLDVLKAVWTRVPKGGVLVFDEYSIEEWAGESQAVDEFLEEFPGQQLRKLSWSNTPGAFVVKA